MKKSFEKKFEKLDQKLFTSLEAQQLAQVSGGYMGKTETLPEITVTPSGNKTDNTGNPNDGNDPV